VHRLFREWHKQPLLDGLKLLTRRCPPSVQDIVSPPVVRVRC
jgi:hypothetical protein